LTRIREEIFEDFLRTFLVEKESIYIFAPALRQKGSKFIEKMFKVQSLRFRVRI